MLVLSLPPQGELLTCSSVLSPALTLFILSLIDLKSVENERWLHCAAWFVGVLEKAHINLISRRCQLLTKGCVLGLNLTLKGL